MGNQPNNMIWRPGPEYETVTGVSKSGLDFWVLESKENGIDGQFLVIGREKLFPLLGVSFGAVQGIDGLDPRRLAMAQLDKSLEWVRVDFEFHPRGIVVQNTSRLGRLWCSFHLGNKVVAVRGLKLRSRFGFHQQSVSVRSGCRLGTAVSSGLGSVDPGP